MSKFIDEAKALLPDKSVEAIINTICPYKIGLEKENQCAKFTGNCTACWYREMPGDEGESTNEVTDENRPITHNEEIALRLVESWLSQPGDPVRMDRILETYDKVLKHLEESDDKRETY